MGSSPNTNGAEGRYGCIICYIGTPSPCPCKPFSGCHDCVPPISICRDGFSLRETNAALDTQHESPVHIPVVLDPHFGLGEVPNLTFEGNTFVDFARNGGAGQFLADPFNLQPITRKEHHSHIVAAYENLLRELPWFNPDRAWKTPEGFTWMIATIGKLVCARSTPDSAAARVMATILRRQIVSHDEDVQKDPPDRVFDRFRKALPTNRGAKLAACSHELPFQ